MILVTGGAGFIDANFVLDWLTHGDKPVVNQDKLTYAGNLASLRGDGRHVFVHGDIGGNALWTELLACHTPSTVVNFAAESHMDSSVLGPDPFVQTNIVYTLPDELSPRADGQPYAQQITYVKDRPGHDRRYAIDARKIERELGWRPAETFESGIRKTVAWYLAHGDWVKQVQSGAYRDWVSANYAQREPGHSPEAMAAR